LALARRDLPGGIVAARIENWLRKQDFDVGDSMELETLDAIGSMVYENLGVAIVPRQCVPAKAHIR